MKQNPIYNNHYNINFVDVIRLLNGFRSDSAEHKEMLAILAALTAVINESSGTGSSTEYFLLLVINCQFF